MSTSLGASLIALRAKPEAAESEALRKRVQAKGPCAVEDLTLVELFFRDAALSFSMAILSGILPRPVTLCRGCNEKVAATLQTFRWTSDFDVRSPEHPYHAIWLDFAAWSRANGLEPTLTGTPGTKGAMFMICVQPS